MNEQNSHRSKKRNYVDLYFTNNEQKASIALALSQIKHGLGIDAATADNEIDQWLGK
ncbi:hypothetical protein [Fulvivirga ligni]|uniref:hypothetical protein n=1 Tax=Fulvivirga ligni TaxID=2904246 RepID=UPI001F3C59D5|nr:hypothetical protein [Fulvivirga ligni]UII23194.1 hypothetical protein LVD16_08135 [Fulvivirga ligni]